MERSRERTGKYRGEGAEKKGIQVPYGGTGDVGGGRREAERGRSPAPPPELSANLVKKGADSLLSQPLEGISGSGW